jgi:hypothetical protein
MHGRYDEVKAARATALPTTLDSREEVLQDLAFAFLGVRALLEDDPLAAADAALHDVARVQSLVRLPPVSVMLTIDSRGAVIA